MRENLGRSAAAVVGILYTAFVGWSLYGAVFPVETHTFRMVHLGFIFALGFLVYPISRQAGRWSVYLDLTLALLGVAALFLLSLGVVGYFRGPMELVERAVLIAAAVIMALFPIDLSFQGLVPLAVGLFVLLRNFSAHRKETLR